MSAAIATKREQSVRKANHLIQKSRHQLSVAEQKAILYICSMIKPTDESLEYEIEIADYIKVCGMVNSGTNYEDVKNTLKLLRDKSWYLPPDENGDEVLVGWLAKARTNKKTGLAKIVIDEDLKPFLLNVSERFTQYQLINILGLTSSYAIHLYEVLKSREWVGHWIVSVDDFKHQFIINKIKTYDKWAQVKRKVIDVAVNQINNHTDLNVEYLDNGIQGRKTTQIAFRIQSKSDREFQEVKKQLHDILDNYSSLEEEKADKNLWQWANKAKKKEKTGKENIPISSRKSRIVEPIPEWYIRMKNEESESNIDVDFNRSEPPEGQTTIFDEFE